MNIGKTVFAQIMEFLPLLEFRKCVERYNGNYKVKNFLCLDQFLCMAFAQLTYRESLRDIEACLRAVSDVKVHDVNILDDFTFLTNNFIRISGLCLLGSGPVRNYTRS